MVASRPPRTAVKFQVTQNTISFPASGRWEPCTPHPCRIHLIPLGKWGAALPGTLLIQDLGTALGGQVGEPLGGFRKDPKLGTWGIHPPTPGPLHKQRKASCSGPQECGREVTPGDRVALNGDCGSGESSTLGDLENCSFRVNLPPQSPGSWGVTLQHPPFLAEGHLHSPLPGCFSPMPRSPGDKRK
jgi:hypothetical protein